MAPPPFVHRTSHLAVLCSGLLLLLIGCQQAYRVSSQASSRAEKADSAAPAFESSEGFVAGDRGGLEKSAQDPLGNPPAAAFDRKIIYTARIAVVVENFDGVESAIKQIVEQYGGYIADANLGQMRGERRSGSWTLRIPVEHFNTVLDAASQIGIPTTRSQNAQDVTEEYVDLEARIANKRKLEGRILELLERPDDKIQHVIEVERELGRVREEIERMEGRRRYLQDRIAMTTITLTVTEEEDYVPPQAPTFGNRIAKAWNGSIENTRQFLENSVVFLIGNAIPIVFWGGLALVALFTLRRIIRRPGSTER